MAFLLAALSLLAVVGCADGAVTASLTQTNTWTSGSTAYAQYTVVLANSGSSSICSVVYKLTLPSGASISSSWNMVSQGSSQYSTESWVSIGASSSDSSAGFIMSGSSSTPTISVVSSSACSSTTTTTVAAATTTTTAAGTTTTTTAAGTTTTTTASGTTTTTTASSSSSSCSSSSTTCVVSTDSTNAAINSCYEGNATGTITSYLNTAITGGEFTFYGASGTGACGLDSGLPTMSATASGTFFSTGSWVAPCSGSQYIYNNAVCINKCVKITYTCVGCSTAKTLTVPINNECPECATNHVDLSEPAFLWLEPQGGTVGVATDATITYIECP